MKKIFTGFLLLMVFLVFSKEINGQMMGNFWQKDNISSEIINHTKKEEAEGKKIFEDLKKGRIKCQDLREEDFGLIGEYLMGLKTGESHSWMNAMMIRMMGEEGEKQAHINLGKRDSGCFGDKSFIGFKGGDLFMMGPWMMGNFGWGVFGFYWFLISFLFLIVLILLVVYLWKKINEPTEKK